MTRAVPSKHGEALGRELARLADSQVAAHPEIRERCLTCAFTEGSMTSKMAPTIIEVMHCVVGTDEAPFGCHHGLAQDGQPTELCAGYLLCREASFEEVKAAVMRAYEALGTVRSASGDMTDPVFAAWRAEHDPDDKLDDYERAREYAKFQRKA